MFDKFGEFDSVEELNRVAAAQKKEGDEDAVFALAKENGIDKEDAEDFLDGFVDEFVNPLMAAVGKLKVEGEELELKGIVKEWQESIIESCSDDKELCIAVRKKGKKLKECLASLIKFSFENKVQVSDKIVDATKVMHNGKLEQMRKPLYLGMPNKAEVKKLIREYYLS